MNIKFLYCVFGLFFLTNINLFSQNKLPEYGQIAQEEMRELFHPKDTVAEAAILFDIGETKFDDSFNIRFKRRTRIKIYKKTGFEWANVYVPLYVKNKQNPEFLEEVKAHSFNHENGQIIRYELNKKDIFKDKRNEFYDIIRFTIPNVKQGSVIEFEYTFVTPYSTNLPDWQFQHKIPVNWSEYNLALPPFFEYQMIGTGFQKFFINETKPSKYQRTVGGYQFNESIFRMAMKDIPSFKDEPFITSENDYIAQMNFQLAKYEFPGRSKENYMKTWETLVEKLLEDFKIGEHLGDKAGKEEAISITQDIPESEPLKKAKAIYTFVQKSFRFNGIETLQVLVPPKKLMLSKEGNCTDIHILLCNMLNHVGIKAKPVIISTREHGKINTNYPLLEKFNYTLVLVNIGQDQYLLDATNPYLIFGMLPAQCINGFGLILEKVKGKPAQFIILEQPVAYTHRTHVIMRFNQEQKKYETQVSLLLQGYASLQARNTNLTEEKFKQSIQSDTVNKLTIKNMETVSNPIEIKFHTPQEFDETAEIIYLELPFIHPDFAENPFKKNERNFAIDFTYKRDYVYTLNLEIPEGYRLEEVPASLDEEIANSLITFKLNSTKISEKLHQISFQFKVSKPVIDHEQYAQIKNIYTKAVTKTKELIVLKKIK